MSSGITCLALPLVVLFGCSNVQSSDLKTAGMSANMLVSADGSGQTSVSANLHVDNNFTDFVDLASGDTLVASAGSQSQTLSRQDILGAISYQASFTGLASGGTQYTIAFNRASDVSAPSSTCVLPAPFSITAPGNGMTFSRANDNIVITYSPSGTQDQMSWHTDSGCVQVAQGGPTFSGDPGTLTIPKGTLTPVDSSHTNATCQAQITIVRSRPGQLDSHFGYGGSITAQQVRVVTMNSAP